MRGSLLDTNVALMAVREPERLSPRIREALRTGPNVLSTVVYWEVVLKAMRERLEVRDPRTWWQDTLDQLAATALPMRADHVVAILDLPPIHQDPFDRALVAQAMVEGLDLLTTDGVLPRYANARLRVIR